MWKYITLIYLSLVAMWIPCVLVGTSFSLSGKKTTVGRWYDLFLTSDMHLRARDRVAVWITLVFNTDYGLIALEGTPIGTAISNFILVITTVTVAIPVYLLNFYYHLIRYEGRYIYTSTWVVCVIVASVSVFVWKRFFKK